MRVDKSLIYKFCEAEYNLPFADIYFFDEFVISQAREGVTFSKSELISLIGAITKHFPEETSFDFISNRVNDFSIDPIDLKWFLGTFKNMRSYNVAYYESPSKANITLETLFVPVPVFSYPHLVLVLEALYSSKTAVNFGNPNLN
ncbi:MAG: hypothetical protein ABJM06_02995 [Gilvibacter sp.]